jgi:hypothetical protein
MMNDMDVKRQFDRRDVEQLTFFIAFKTVVFYVSFTITYKFMGKFGKTME